MENGKWKMDAPSMKIEIKWGLIFSLVALLWVVLEYAVGLHGRYISWHPYLTNLFVIPAFIMMFLAIREKQRVLGGSITFKEAFLCGLGVSVIVAILAPAIQYIFHRFINPSFFENAVNYAVGSGKATPEQANAYFNLQSYMLQSSLGALVAGVITSLIIAAILRSKNVRSEVKRSR
jgi:hypothetical protein